MRSGSWSGAVVGLALAASASASLINLSDLSSDGAVDPADLTATTSFSVKGNLLSITVTNLAAGYTLSEFFWNAPDGVTLAFIGILGWTLATGLAADGFGTFDFALTQGAGGHNPISFNESVKFDFTITGGNPLEEDFTSLLSEGGIPALGAAQFGQRGSFVIGAAIPAPAGLALLGLAGLGRRRRRSCSCFAEEQP